MSWRAGFKPAAPGTLCVDVKRPGEAEDDEAKKRQRQMASEEAELQRQIEQRRRETAELEERQRQLALARRPQRIAELRESIATRKANIAEQQRLIKSETAELSRLEGEDVSAEELRRVFAFFLEFKRKWSDDGGRFSDDGAMSYQRYMKIILSMPKRVFEMAGDAQFLHGTTTEFISGKAFHVMNPDWDDDDDDESESGSGSSNRSVSNRSVNGAKPNEVPTEIVAIMTRARMSIEFEGVQYTYYTGGHKTFEPIGDKFKPVGYAAARAEATEN